MAKFYKMKKIVLFSFIFSFNSFAENSRSPAVLESSCNLKNIPTTVTEIIDGKEIIKERSTEDVLKDRCKEVKKCMNSATDEEMVKLSVEDVECNNKLSALTTKTPGLVVDKNFNGKRNAKPNTEENPSMPTTGSTSISK